MGNCSISKDIYFRKDSEEEMRLELGKSQRNPWAVSWSICMYRGVNTQKNYQLNGHEFEQTPGDREGQGTLLDMTQ